VIITIAPVQLVAQDIDYILIEDLSKIGLSLDSITASTVDDQGKIWIGSDDGLWVFDGDQFREYTYKDGLFDKTIHDLYYSSSGQIWAATSGGAFTLIDGHFYVFEPLKNQEILTISENASTWLFHTQKGLRIFNKEEHFSDSIVYKIAVFILFVIGVAVLILWALKRFRTNVQWKADLIRVEQAALLVQMNPHFIFNSLNSVQKYILTKDIESANSYLQKFAGMMRKVLENSSQSVITLSEEIATLELYLELESLRFDNGFDFEIRVMDDDIWQLEIPTMLLHTFVENAIWHGLMKKESRGKIDLRFSKIDKNLIQCEIKDNGIGRKKAAEYKSKERIKHKSKGIEIVNKRIVLLNLKRRRKITCETIDLEEQHPDQTGTLVRLHIPVVLG
jgi:hypothetical protein